MKKFIKEAEGWLDEARMRMLSFLFNIRIHIYRIGEQDTFVPRQNEQGNDMVIFVENPQPRTERPVQDHYLLHFQHHFEDRDHLDGNHFARLEVTPVAEGVTQTRSVYISEGSKEFQLEDILNLLFVPQVLLSLSLFNKAS